DCPPDLDEIIMTALAKSPDERWQTAGAMHRALDHVAKNRGLQATNREIAEWLDWAFQQPLQSRRVELTPRTEVARPSSTKEPTLKSGPVVPVENLDSASIELVWGGRVIGRNRRDSGAAAPGDIPDSSPYPLDDGRGSQPVPVQSLADAGSGAVPAQGNPAPGTAGDGSQPYPRIAMPGTAGDGSQPYPRIAMPGPGPSAVSVVAAGDSRAVSRPPIDPRQS